MLSLENHHRSLPVFEPSDHNSFLAHFNLLNISAPHHQSVSPAESLPRSRSLSAARGQNCNLYNSLYPQVFGSTHDDEYMINNQNGSGQGLTRPVHLETGRVRPTYIVRPNMTLNGPVSEYCNYQVKDFRGEIKLMAKHKKYSEILKLKIEGGMEEDLELIFEELKDDVAGLMVHYFGSDVVQKLFKVCAPEQISYMLCLLVRFMVQFAEICCNNHGSLSMEKLLQNLSTHDQRSSVISALSGLVLHLSNDQNGHKVVEYCIYNFPENADVLINEIAEYCFEITTHKTGCCVMQRILDIAFGETMHRLMYQLAPNAVLLAEHQYGNYVVQHLLDKKNSIINRNIVEGLAGNFVSLSMDRCGSNVVEKCLVCTSDYEAAVIIIEIMNSEYFLMILQDQFGNYVVQTALEVSQKMRQREVQDRLMKQIRIFEKYLKNHPYGNRVLLKLNNLPSRF